MTTFLEALAAVPFSNLACVAGSVLIALFLAIWGGATMLQVVTHGAIEIRRQRLHELPVEKTEAKVESKTDGVH